MDTLQNKGVFVRNSPAISLTAASRNHRACFALTAFLSYLKVETTVSRSGGVFGANRKESIAEFCGNGLILG